MTTPNGNGTRGPTSAARNGASGASVSMQTVLIVYALQHAGFSGTPQEITAVAAGAAAAWAFIGGAIARTCRDELHALEHSGERGHVLRRIALGIGSALG